MASSFVSAPGTEYGPCVEPCEHIDCAASRRESETPCGLCPEPIGYDRDFFNDRALGLVHAQCLYRLVDSQEATA